MQLEVVAGMAGLVVGEVEEADPGRDHLRPDLHVLREQPCLADRGAVAGAERAGGDGWDIIAAAKTATS